MSFLFNLEPRPAGPIKTTNRQINGLFPRPESLKILEGLQKYESNSMHGQMPIIWDKASGSQIEDPYGNKWIDFTSTIFVANAGHSHPHIKKTLRDQIDNELLHAYNYPTRIRLEFLKKLINDTPAYFEKAYLMSTGTEATECLIKLTRMYGKKVGKNKPLIVSFEGAYHGRTIGAAQIGGNKQSQEWIGYHDPNIVQVPFPYEWEMNDKSGEEVFNDHLEFIKSKGFEPTQDICGFIFEAYIGWAAAYIPKSYVQAVKKFCNENKALLSFDEVQGGFSRTGKMFVYEHYNVKADMIACGKGISSSLPLSAVLGRSELMDLCAVGSMSSTHSANPMSCAAGLANLEIIEKEGLTKIAQEKGEFMHKRLLEIKEKSNGYIKRITGTGLLAALIFENPDTHQPESKVPSNICETAMRNGLILIHTGRESIKIAPPLTISYDVLEEGLMVLEESVINQTNCMTHAA